MLKGCNHLLRVGMVVHPPLQLLLHHFDEGLQRISDTELADLGSPEEVQICWHFPQGRHGRKGRHTDNVLGQAHALWDQEALAGGSQGLQGHQLTAALGIDQALAGVGHRGLWHEAAKDLQNIGDLLAEGLLVPRGQKLQQHLGHFAQLVLCIGVLLVSPACPTSLRVVKNGLNCANAIMISGNCVSVGLHTSKYALWQLGPCGACAGRGR
mmetsp:Transcript_33132/g.79297  ORF Transcript_33132/g.79297 Transcript_33132/m.79297 type:complete len:211 (-) Transcript_33132:1185-1817(-)